MRTYQTAVREGMTVHSADGHKLGKIAKCTASGFVVEKGIFFPSDHLATWADIASVEGDDVHLSANQDDLLPSDRRAAMEERGEWAPPGTDDPVVEEAADDDHGPRPGRVDVVRDQGGLRADPAVIVPRDDVRKRR